MNNNYKTFLASIAFLIIVSCQDTNPLFGKWKLSSWDIGLEMNLNEDTIKSFNLLDEVDCKNKEVLTIKSDGTINSVNTFSPLIKISKTNKKYNLNASCNEGSIGFASSYKIVDDIIVIEPNDQEYYFNGNELTKVFKKAIKVYDSSFTKIIEAKDLTLNYIK